MDEWVSISISIPYGTWAMSLIQPMTLRLPPTAIRSAHVPQMTLLLQLKNTGDALSRQILFNNSNQKPPEVPNEDLHTVNRL